MSWVARLFVGLVTLGLIAVALALGAWHSFVGSPATRVTAETTFDVPSGTSAHALLARLQGEGLVRPSPLWRVWLATGDLGACLQAGTHTLRPGLTPDALRDLLCTPTRGAGTRVTIPEGRNLWQMAALLEDAGLGQAEAFVALAFDPAFLRRLGVAAESLEGRWFPDTWEFAPDTPPEVVLRRMHRRFVEVWSALLQEHGEAFERIERTWGVDADGVLILASLVETEAAVPDERARIARVFYNRLARGMRLQTDPTCVYGSDRWHERPSPRRCRDPESRFSTYVIDGLPPTPISGVGRASLLAALHPTDEPDILYFVAMRDGTGRHAFARTLREHNQNVDRYLRRR